MDARLGDAPGAQDGHYGRIEPDPRVHEVAFLVAMPDRVRGATIVRVDGYRAALGEGYASAVVMLCWHHHPVALAAEPWSTHLLVYRHDEDPDERWTIHRAYYFDDYYKAAASLRSRVHAR